MELIHDATYQVYLLRLWREQPASPERQAVWRFSLEDARSSERRGFSSPEALVEFLQERMQVANAQQGGDEKKAVRVSVGF